MFMSRAAWIIALCASAVCALPGTANAQGRFGFGHEATQEEIGGWDIDARPDGSGLPEGSGTVAQGHEVYNARCSSCHAEDLNGPMGALVGGIGSLNTDKPLRTVGSYWPYATTLWDYVFRSMPFDAPQSLTADEVYAVSAYVLFRNGIIKEDEVMNAKALPQVKMPNRDGFFPDDRPDVFNTACRQDCKRGQHIGMPMREGQSGAPTRPDIGGSAAPQ